MNPSFDEHARCRMPDGGPAVDLGEQHAAARFFARDREMEQHPRHLARELRTLRLGLGQKEEQFPLAAPEIAGRARPPIA
jgi:hypothetical protein